jgi:hypothetical protein
MSSLAPAAIRAPIAMLSDKGKVFIRSNLTHILLYSHESRCSQHARITQLANPTTTMTFTKVALFLLCSPYLVHGIRVESGFDIPGSLDDKALDFANYIAGPGVKIIDAMFDLCDDDQLGYFRDARLELGMKFRNGIVLSSGFAADVVGGNVYGSDAFDHKGYQALTNLLPPGGNTKDACALHITFECDDHEHFGLDFVFGSDNYGCYNHDPAKNNFDDVMGIFAQDNLNRAKDGNIGLYNDDYISVNNFYGGPHFINNCDGNINIDMKGYSYPLKIGNEKRKIVTGENELWIAVADGFDRNSPSKNDMKKGSWLFIRQKSLVCIDDAAGAVERKPPQMLRTRQ